MLHQIGELVYVLVDLFRPFFRLIQTRFHDPKLRLQLSKFVFRNQCSARAERTVRWDMTQKVSRFAGGASDKRLEITGVAETIPLGNVLGPTKNVKLAQ